MTFLKSAPPAVSVRGVAVSSRPRIGFLSYRSSGTGTGK